jgi:hypothetical protein
MGIPMEALVRQNYGGRAVRQGEIFVVDNQGDFDDLKAMNFGREAPKIHKPVIVEQKQLVTRETSAKENDTETSSQAQESNTPDADATEVLPPQGTYERRDMTARKRRR